jgi:thymidylate synthase
MEQGFPLITTKSMARKSVLVELEGFLRGITDKKWDSSSISSVFEGESNRYSSNEISNS